MRYWSCKFHFLFLFRYKIPSAPAYYGTYTLVIRMLYYLLLPPEDEEEEDDEEDEEDDDEDDPEL